MIQDTDLTEQQENQLRQMVSTGVSLAPSFLARYTWATELLSKGYLKKNQHANNYIATSKAVDYVLRRSGH